MHKQQNTKSKPTVLVIGGRGFIGRHIVKYLNNIGANVVIGSRYAQHPSVSQQVIRKVALHQVHSVTDLEFALDGVDIVVNAVGILRQRFAETYDQVHVKAVKILADACQQQGIRFVHISALGIYNNVQSRFSLSKRLAERVLLENDTGAVIVRPSLVDGEGGFGAHWFRRISQWPVFFIPASAQGRFAPIDAHDLGEAVAKIALQQTSLQQQVYELGGMHTFSLLEYLHCLRGDCRYQAMVLKVPTLLARAVSHICDVLHATPYSYGHFELLKFDNMPEYNHLESVLGRPASMVGVNKHRKKLSPSPLY